MGINFPNTPAPGDLWPNPAVAGQGQYTWDGEKWTAGSTPASRASIYAAPFDAMAYNGMQINGSMEVSQEGAAATVNGKYCCDGWLLSVGGIPGGIAVQDNLVPVPGFSGRVWVNTTTAKGSLAASDILLLTSLIEGYRVSRLGWGTVNAQPITIGFWAQHTLSGAYSVSVRNNAADRSYVAMYTQNVAGALEYKTVTIPGCTDGTWLMTNGIGLVLCFAAAVGSTPTASSVNAWLVGNFVAGTGQVNVAASTSNYLNLRGVVVLPGLEAPSAARSPLIMRPYDQELVTCMRYLEPVSTGSMGYVSGATSALVTSAYRVIKRTNTPTLLTPAGTYSIFAGGSFNSTTAPVFSTNDATGALLNLGGFSGLTVNTAAFLLSHPGMKIDARL